jgi:hypothetical protein
MKETAELKLKRKAQKLAIGEAVNELIEANRDHIVRNAQKKLPSILERLIESASEGHKQ